MTKKDERGNLSQLEGYNRMMGQRMAEVQEDIIQNINKSTKGQPGFELSF